MALNTIVVTKYAVYAQFTRSLLVKKTRHRLTHLVAKCTQLRKLQANCANNQPFRSSKSDAILPMQYRGTISRLISSHYSLAKEYY